MDYNIVLCTIFKILLYLTIQILIVLLWKSKLRLFMILSILLKTTSMSVEGIVMIF